MGMAACHHTSNGYKSAMLELMSNQGVKDSIKGLTCFSETTHLDDFFEILRTKDDQAAYGLKSVRHAFSSAGATKTLLISDHLFRSKSAAVRKIYVDLA